MTHIDESHHSLARQLNQAGVGSRPSLTRVFHELVLSYLGTNGVE
jgi:hypothetical protein